MTRKQFLKKSSRVLKDISLDLLSFMELMEKENNGTINTDNAQKKLEIIRCHVEDVFFQYEKIKSPSDYHPLHLRILKLMTSLQEVVVVNQIYIESDFSKDLKESKRLLEQFRQEFRLVKSEIEKDLKQ